MAFPFSAHGSMTVPVSGARLHDAKRELVDALLREGGRDPWYSEGQVSVRSGLGVYELRWRLFSIVSSVRFDLAPSEASVRVNYQLNCWLFGASWLVLLAVLSVVAIAGGLVAALVLPLVSIPVAAAVFRWANRRFRVTAAAALSSVSLPTAV